MINKLLRDDRMVPRIAALLQLLAMVEDSETPEEKTFYMNVVTAQYGNDPKRIRWTDPEDPPSSETHLTRLDAKYTEQAKSIFGNILGDKQ